MTLIIVSIITLLFGIGLAVHWVIKPPRYWRVDQNDLTI